MRHYRCYFLVGESSKAVEDIRAKDDADALLQAEELLPASSFAPVEVWQEKRLVGRLTVSAGPVVIGDSKAPTGADRGHRNDQLDAGPGDPAGIAPGGPGANRQELSSGLD